MLIETSTNGRSTAASSVRALNLADWLKRLRFRKSSPCGLRTAAGEGDAHRFAVELKETLQLRRPNGDGPRLPAGMGSATSNRVELGALEELAASGKCGKRELRERLTEWLGRPDESFPDRDSWRTAAWLLVTRAKDLSADLTLSLWRRLLTEADRFPTTNDEAPSPTELLLQGTLESELLQGVLFQDLQSSQPLLKRTVQGFRQALDDSTDTDGTPHARLLERLPELLETVLRASSVSTASDLELWNKSARKRIDRLLDRAAALVTPHGVSWLTIEPAEFASLVASLSQVLDLEDRSWLRRLAEGKSLREKRKGKPTGRLAEPCHQSDWAEWGSLRSEWSAPGDVCNFRYDGLIPRLELTVAGIPCLNGPWAHTLRIDGVDLPNSGTWSCVCWYDDDQAALVELEQAVEPGVRVIRQVILLREECLLLLADSIRAPQGRSFEFTRTLPVSPGWEYLQDAATRETAFSRKKGRVRVVPLTAPQFRVLGSAEATVFKDGMLQATVTAPESRAYLATVLDWHPERRDSEVEWTQLTVAEDGKSLPASVARGLRLRIDHRQWLLYHSLDRPAIPRTVLGQHTPNETILSEICADAAFKSLVEVEF